MTFTGLPPSGYQLGEVQLPEGWGAVSLVCVDDVTGDEVVSSTGGAGVTVPLAAGQQVTCTAINALLGQITVAKETDPADASDVFTFTVSGETISPFTASLSDNNSLEQPTKVQPASRAVAIAGDKFAVDLAPRSLTVLRVPAK